MRIPLLLLIAPAFVHAQNWALLNPAYKYNYSDDGTDTISNQVFVTHIDTLGPDSFLLQLSRTTAYCDTCLSGTGGVTACDGCYIWNNAPDLLGPDVRVSQGDWIFGGLDNTLIRTTAAVGSTWPYSSGGGTAEVTAVDTAYLWGVLDSIKLISLSGGDSIILSKDHGLLRFPGAPASGDKALVGIEVAGLGIVKPDFHGFFPYQPGDVLEYEVANGGADGIGGIYGSWAHFKMTLTSVTDFGDSLHLDVEPICSSGSFNGGCCIFCAHYTTGTFRISPGEVHYTPLTATRPGELFIPQLPWTQPLAFDACVAKHYRDGDGRYHISTSSRNAPGWDQDHFNFLMTTPTAIPGLYAYGPADDASGDPFGLHYVEGIGLLSYVVNYFETWISYVLVGAVIGGDTIGVVHDDVFFSVPDMAGTAPLIRPVPADHELNLTFEQASETSWCIIDPTGRTILNGTITGKTGLIGLTSLPEGAYLLRCAISHGISTQRFIIAR